MSKHPKRHDDPEDTSFEVEQAFMKRFGISVQAMNDLPDARLLMLGISQVLFTIGGDDDIALALEKRATQHTSETT